MSLAKQAAIFGAANTRVSKNRLIVDPREQYKLMDAYMKAKGSEEPTSAAKAGLIGAGLGAGAGALYGMAVGSKLRHAGIGGLLGAGVGGLIGAGMSDVDAQNVAAARRYAALSPAEKKKTLKSIAVESLDERESHREALDDYYKTMALHHMLSRE